MPDKQSRRKARRRAEWLINPKRLRLYSDEDVDSGAVSQLRRARVNILTAAEAGNLGKDDRAQAAFAKRERRVLLTRNCKHFLDDRRVPLQTTRGVIAIDVDPADIDGCLSTLAIISEFLVPWGEIYEDMKIKVSPTGITLRYLDWSGKRVVERLTLDDLFEGRFPGEEPVQA